MFAYGWLVRSWLYHHLYRITDHFATSAIGYLYIIVKGCWRASLWCIVFTIGAYFGSPCIAIGGVSIPLIGKGTCHPIGSGRYGKLLSGIPRTIRRRSHRYISNTRCRLYGYLYLLRCFTTIGTLYCKYIGKGLSGSEFSTIVMEVWFLYICCR